MARTKTTVRLSTSSGSPRYWPADQRLRDAAAAAAASAAEEEKKSSSGNLLFSSEQKQFEIGPQNDYANASLNEEEKRLDDESKEFVPVAVSGKKQKTKKSVSTSYAKLKEIRAYQKSLLRGQDENTSALFNIRTFKRMIKQSMAEILMVSALLNFSFTRNTRALISFCIFNFFKG
jgi:hypothetical protein